MLSCQAEARRLALTTLIVRFTDFLVHKSVFTKGFWLAAAEKLYDGAIAETANVVRALAIHNSTLWKRGVHADGQNRMMQCVIEVIVRSQWSAHTRNPLTRMTSWYKPDLTQGIQQRVGNSKSECEMLNPLYTVRWMDWTVENNMVNGQRSVRLRHTHRPQKGPYPVSVSRNGNVRHRCGGGYAGHTLLLARPFQEGGCRCQGWKYGVSYCSPTTPHSIGDPPRAQHVCCCYQMNWWVFARRVQMGVSI